MGVAHLNGPTKIRHQVRMKTVAGFCEGPQIKGTRQLLSSNWKCEKLEDETSGEDFHIDGKPGQDGLVGLNILG